MISLELRDTVIQYIDQAINLEQFEDWIVPRLPDFLDSFNSTDADIISAIELGLAEINNENWSEEKFRTYLHETLQEVVVLVQVPFSLEGQTSGSSNTTQELRILSSSFEYQVVR